MALLIYLAAHPREEFPRSHLCALLWSGRNEADARRNFNTMVSRLRKELPVWPVRAEHDRLGWDSEAPVTVDVADVAQRASALLDLWARQEQANFADGVKDRTRFERASVPVQTLRDLADVCLVHSATAFTVTVKHLKSGSIRNVRPGRSGL